MCRQYNRQKAERPTYLAGKPVAEKLSINRITNHLKSKVNGYYSRWKNERKDEELALLIAQSLTNDRREQRQLLILSENNSERMKQFLEYVRKQGPYYYILRLDVPRFQGSLLFDPDFLKPGEKEAHARRTSYERQGSISSSQNMKLQGNAKGKTGLNKNNRKAVFQLSSKKQPQTLLLSENMISGNNSHDSLEGTGSYGRNISRKGSQESAVQRGKAHKAQQDKLDLIRIFQQWLEYANTNDKRRSIIKSLKRRSEDLTHEKARETVLTRLIQNSADQNTTRSHKNSISETNNIGRSLSNLRDMSHLRSFQGSNSTNGENSIVGGYLFQNLRQDQKRQRSLTHFRNKSSGMPMSRHISQRNEDFKQMAIPEEELSPPQILLPKNQESEFTLTRDETQLVIQMGMQENDQTPLNQPVELVNAISPHFAHNSSLAVLDQPYKQKSNEASSSVTGSQLMDHLHTLRQHTLETQHGTGKFAVALSSPNLATIELNEKKESQESKDQTPAKVSIEGQDINQQTSFYSLKPSKDQSRVEEDRYKQDKKVDGVDSSVYQVASQEQRLNTHFQKITDSTRETDQSGRKVIKTIDFNSCVMRMPRQLSFDQNCNKLGTIAQQSKPLDLVPSADHPSKKAGGSLYHVRLNQIRKTRKVRTSVTVDSNQKQNSVGSQQFKTTKATWVSPLEQRRTEDEAFKKSREIGLVRSNTTYQLLQPDQLVRSLSPPETQYQLNDKLKSGLGFSRMRKINKSQSNNLFFSVRENKKCTADLSVAKDQPSTKMLVPIRFMVVPNTQHTEKIIIKMKRPITAREAPQLAPNNYYLPKEMPYTPVLSQGNIQNLPTTQFRNSKAFSSINSNDISKVNPSLAKELSSVDFPHVNTNNQMPQRKHKKKSELQYVNLSVESRAYERFTERIMREAKQQPTKSARPYYSKYTSQGAPGPNHFSRYKPSTSQSKTQRGAKQATRKIDAFKKIKVPAKDSASGKSNQSRLQPIGNWQVNSPQ